LFHGFFAGDGGESEYGDVYKGEFISFGFFSFGGNMPGKGFVTDDGSNTALTQLIEIGLVSWATAREDSGHVLVERKVMARRSTTVQQHERREKGQEDLSLLHPL
jgi:hypothetical protein